MQQIRTIENNYPHRSELIEDDLYIRISSTGSVEICHDEIDDDIEYILGVIHITSQIHKEGVKGLETAFIFMKDIDVESFGYII